MGAHHAACGAAAWVALTTRVHLDLAAVADKVPGLPNSVDLGLGMFDFGPTATLSGALFVAGAALAADADHHNATIAHSLPPLSNAICAGIGTVSGGHRHGTHSLVGICAFSVAAWFFSLITPNGFLRLFDLLRGHAAAPVPATSWGELPVGAGILSVLMISFAAKVLRIIPDARQKTPWLVGLAFGLFTVFAAPQQQVWLPFAMAVGMIVHILGDLLTVEGCNLAWPFEIRPPKVVSAIPILRDCWHSNGYMAIPILGHAGSVREWMFLVPVSLYAIIGVGTALVGLGRSEFSEFIAAALG